MMKQTNGAITKKDVHVLLQPSGGGVLMKFPPRKDGQVRDESNSLVIFEQAVVWLAEADTIQKTKELKSKFLTLADWFRRKKMGEETIARCRSYALEAERKMGEMLRATERAVGIKGKPGPGKGKRGRMALPRLGEPPTLADLGLTKRESAQAQRLAELPLEFFEQLKSGEKTRGDVEYEWKIEARSKSVPLVITGAGRPKRLIISPDKKTVRLVIHPNEAGSKSFIWWEAYQSGKPYQAEQTLAATLEKQAVMLDKQAKLLFAQADQVRGDAAETARQAFIAEHGAPINYANYFEFPTPKSGLPKSEQEAANFLLEEINAGRIKPTKRGFVSVDASGWAHLESVDESAAA